MASQLNTRAIDMLPNKKPRQTACATDQLRGYNYNRRRRLLVLDGVEVRKGGGGCIARQRRSSGSATLRTQREAALARFGRAAR
jgi:hypothetical protein